MVCDLRYVSTAYGKVCVSVGAFEVRLVGAGRGDNCVAKIVTGKIQPNSGNPALGGLCKAFVTQFGEFV